MLIKVFCVLSMLNKLPPGVCWGGGGGGGGNRLPGLVTKQQAVEFPQVLTSSVIIILKVPHLRQCLDYCDGENLLKTCAQHAQLLN